MTGLKEKLLVEDVEVEFPFSPYQCQVEYMKSVIRALKSSGNAILESPTGTGKTLSMLCGVLAWRKTQEKPPRLLYASRTHSQLSQVAQELHNLSTQRVSLLASREQFCLHPVISTYNSLAQSSACSAAITSSSCTHHHNYKNFAKPPVDTVRDIEDFVKGCGAHATCPYYTAQQLAQTADVVLLPYNYLTDRSLQHRYKSLIKGAIVVIDEAHNIANFCEKGYTFGVTFAAMNSVLDVVENMTGAEKWGNVCHFLEEFFDTKYQNSFFKFFEDNVSIEDVKELRKCSSGEEEKFAINEMLDFLDNVLEIVKTNTSDSYSITFDAETETLLCVCSDPSISLKNIQKLGARSILLTSGTISPLPSLIKELDIPFTEILQNNHVIKPSQLLAQVVTQGSDGEPMLSSFKNRNSDKYLHSLGTSLINYMRIIPHGLLVFFSSYSAMDAALSFWQRNDGIWQSMKQIKSIHVEPRNKDKFYDTVKRYEQDCTSLESDFRGAVLFAVCRGKLAEGVDLSDEKSRGVIVVGIPYSYPKDPLVEMKMKYLDRVKIGGKGWYQQTAFRAVNQALGRAIRHGGDYGAMILLDERFADNKFMLPKWISSHLSVATNFGSSVKTTAQFFKHHCTAGPQDETYSNKFKQDHGKSEEKIVLFDFPILSRSVSVLSRSFSVLYRSISVITVVLIKVILAVSKFFVFLVRPKK